jgi:omega-6 fatty acid desaturase (delta-12 desaturase)
MDFERHALRALHARSSVKGTAIFVLDLIAYVAVIGSCLLTHILVVKLALSIVAGIITSLLFVVGHDACHQSLTPRRWLNRLLGTLAFLPSLHPFSLWELGHNRIHHRYTNRRGKDYVWEPLSLAEFGRLSRLRQLRYRFFRTFAGHFCYYFCDIWWRKMFYPRSHEIGGYRREYRVDLLIVSAWMVIFPTGVAGLTYALSAGPCGAYELGLSVLACCVVPFLVFNFLMSSVIFLHHMHPQVGWVPTGERVDSQQMQIQSAVHVVFPGYTNLVFHRIMEHTAHHVRPGIPLYHLNNGQTLLESTFPEIIVQKWSLRYHVETTARCKLFDLERRCWTDYEGIRTSLPRIAPGTEDSKMVAAATVPLRDRASRRAA